MVEIKGGSELFTETFQNLDQTSLKVWNLFTDAQFWLGWAEKLLIIIIILVGMRITRRIGDSLIERLLRKRSNLNFQVDERRVNTLRVLLKNVFHYSLTFIGFMMILSLFVNILPVLAGAGVLGLAVAFGAQNLVRDVISGFFIIFEDQFAVGDYIRTGAFEGTVQQIGLRITKIKGFTGEIYIIPNGLITEVTNFSISPSVAVVDVSIAYEEEVPQVIRLLEEEVQKIYDGNEIEDLTKKPDVLGVHLLGPSEVVIRVVAECRPTTHWRVKRILQARFKELLDRAGIEIPYPHMVMIQKGVRGGTHE